MSAKLDHMRALLAKAPRRPWEAYSIGGHGYQIRSGAILVASGEIDGGDEDRLTGGLIAAAVNGLPALLGVADAVKSFLGADHVRLRNDHTVACAAGGQCDCICGYAETEALREAIAAWEAT